jgi:hypothetical protein
MLPFFDEVRVPGSSGFDWESSGFDVDAGSGTMKHDLLI